MSLGFAFLPFPKDLCFQFSSRRGVSYGRHLHVKAGMNDWAREALMKSWPVDDVLVQQLCISERRTKRGFVGKDRKYIRLEQGPGNG